MAIIIEVIPFGIDLRSNRNCTEVRALQVQSPLASSRRHNTVILSTWPTAIGSFGFQPIKPLIHLRFITPMI
jgi:hypothetical protein